MKINFTIVLFLSFCFLSAQEVKEFYVVQKIGHSIEPDSISANINDELILSFSKPELQNFFQSKTLYVYEKAFPESINDTLKNTYFIRSESSLSKTNLEGLSDILFVEDISDSELEYMHEPNDYFYELWGGMDYVKNQTMLDLVRAPLAWEVTKGNPGVSIGIVDTPVDISHPELASKIILNEGYPPSSTYSHGTEVSSVAAGDTNNNIGFASIGYNTTLITNSENGNDIPQTEENNSSYYRIRAMWKLSLIDGVKVLNGSWGDGSCVPKLVDKLAFEEIKDRGVFTVFAAGNGNTCQNGPEQPSYPNAYSSVFTVTSVGHINQYSGEPLAQDVYHHEIQDVHLRVGLTTGNVGSHSHYPEVDLSAIGYSVIAACNLNLNEHCDNGYKLTWGTSLSSPMVAGAAALMYSVNPNLTPQQVGDILKNTADDIYHIPENQQFIGKLGAGRLNVFRAVKTAECMNEPNPKLDYMVKDSREDVGNEANNESPYFWKSNDIWVRNQNDGHLVHIHQNPEYSPTNPNYVYVRVTNLECLNSSEDEVKLYWSYAGTSQAWPSGWDGTTISGGPIGTATIPELAPGQEAILEFEWYPPNPATAPSPVSLSGNFSLLARIISDDDPISYTIGSNINNYVKRNNNVAWKNINVIDIAADTPKTSASFTVSNMTENTQTYSLELQEDNAFAGKSLYEEAEIGIVMDSILYEKWITGGSSISDAVSTKEQNIKRVSGEIPKLNNITLAPGESGIVEFTFNFLTKELIEKNSYEYNLIQKDNNGEIVGGATILISKENRNDVVADIETSTNSNSTTLVAENIGESAVYNWYDSEGNLIYTGTELTVSPEITKTYKLEIISDLDGFKDYKEVEVTGNSPYSLGTIVPNPASSQVTVSYDASSATSAYLIIINTVTAGSENYILNTNSNQISLNLSNYTSGIYTVTLVCNGAIVDSKSLIKN